MSKVPKLRRLWLKYIPELKVVALKVVVLKVVVVVVVLKVRNYFKQKSLTCISQSFYSSTVANIRLFSCPMMVKG